MNAQISFQTPSPSSQKSLPSQNTPTLSLSRFAIKHLEQLADENVGLELQLDDEGDTFDVETLELIPSPSPGFKDQVKQSIQNIQQKTLQKPTVQFKQPPPSLKPSLQVTKTAIPTLQQRKKFVLKPNHGPLDWDRFKKSTNLNLGITTPLRIPRQEVSKHKTMEDCWMILHGKVYNITPYMDYHPGGVDELMRGAGMDGTILFQKTHSWVNVEYLLDACFLGFAV